MTEAEWLAATLPEPMLDFLEAGSSKRKLRLFLISFAFTYWERLKEPGSRGAILTAERFADGLATSDELEATCQAAVEVDRRLRKWATAAAVSAAGNHPGWPRSLQYAVRHETAAKRQMCALWLHDIFGNPFRPIAIDPAWRTSTVLALSNQMYDTRDFGPTPILADALQDAGCDNDDILSHLRGPGPHVRGCHVIDCILGKG